tara:strand:- start:2 stop:1219 length:1218 start_codon:yes stop_codon:yes gene_type:complete
VKSFKAIRIKQPIGEFFVASISSEIIINFSYSRAAGFQKNGLSGSQRDLKDKRVDEIRNYINTTNAAFPNSIILSANYYETDQLEVDDDKRWRAEEIDEDLFEIVIPDENLELCSIIDGQHRVNGFKKSGINMHLPCAIFIDLPPSMQAFVFSTINFNQQKVDKSLAYQLFGYQLDESDRMMWSPDILAVQLSRSFNHEGPFKGKIKLIKEVAKKKQTGSSDDKDDLTSSWEISSAAFIEGVVSLISGNSKADKYIVNKKKTFGYASRKDLIGNQKYPLRKYYIDGNDSAIKIILDKYFDAIESYLWKGKEESSIVFRAVGVAAQFTFLKELIISGKIVISKDIDFHETLSCLSDVKFEGEYFSARSATKKRVVDVLKLKTGLLTLEEIENREDKDLLIAAAKVL